MTTPPGPHGHFLFGHLHEFNRDTLQMLSELRQYGDFVKLRFGPFPVYVANHPDPFHEILVSDASKYFKTRVTKVALDDILGNGLFVNDGDSWKRQRKLTQPAFHTKRIANYAEVIVDYANQLAEQWHSGEHIEVDREMTSLTMRIISKTLFDASVTGEEDALGEAITTALKIVDDRFRRLMPLPRWLPLRENRDMRQALTKLDSIVQSFIDERRRTGEDKGDLLSMLLMAQDEDGGSGMTDKQVRDEAMTLFGAGHETTANALTWTWYLLSQNPEALEKLQAELDTVLGGRLPTYEDLPRLQYTEMVIKESMRIFPPAWGTSREAIQDVTVSGYPLKKDSIVLINIYGVHRDERFFPDPLKFIPERFSPENEKTIPKLAYLPFGAGPRVCIGNAFAMMEAKLILATLAQRFELALTPGHTVKDERIFVLRPKFGMSMIAHKRESVLA